MGHKVDFMIYLEWPQAHHPNDIIDQWYWCVLLIRPLRLVASDTIRVGHGCYYYRDHSLLIISRNTKVIPQPRGIYCACPRQWWLMVICDRNLIKSINTTRLFMHFQVELNIYIQLGISVPFCLLIQRKIKELYEGRRMNFNDRISVKIFESLKFNFGEFFLNLKITKLKLSQKFKGSLIFYRKFVRLGY